MKSYDPNNTAQNEFHLMSMQKNEALQNEILFTMKLRTSVILGNPLKTYNLKTNGITAIITVMAEPDKRKIIYDEIHTAG